MKILSFAEIGLNHLGKVSLLDIYLDKLLATNVDGITIQVLKDEFYTKKYKKYKISESNMINFINKIKKKKKLVGIVTNDIQKIKFFNRLKVDFYKVLSTSVKDIELIKKLIKTRSFKIFLSTGLVNYDEIQDILKKINKKKISLIHTSFEKNKNDINLKRINILKKKFKLPICYGNHSKYIKSLIEAKKYSPYAVFFYVKLEKKLKFPDSVHALKIGEIKNFI